MLNTPILFYEVSIKENNMVGGGSVVVYLLALKEMQIEWIGSLTHTV